MVESYCYCILSDLCDVTRHIPHYNILQILFYSDNFRLPRRYSLCHSSKNIIPLVAWLLCVKQLTKMVLMFITSTVEPGYLAHPNDWSQVVLSGRWSDQVL